MQNTKDNKYYLKKIIDDISFIINNTKDISLKAFSDNEILNSAICFKFTQISENSKKLSQDLIDANSSIPWKMIIGLRNKIIHDYGNVDFSIIFATINNDLPVLKEALMKINK